MHTPGPWRSLRLDSSAYYTPHIDVAAGHIASIVGWADRGTSCQITAGNGRLIEHAADITAALNDLLVWADVMGRWDASCWRRARTILEHATRERRLTPLTLLRQPAETVATAGCGQGWNTDTKILLLADFLDAEAPRDPSLAERLQQHLLEAASS